MKNVIICFILAILFLFLGYFIWTNEIRKDIIEAQEAVIHNQKEQIKLYKDYADTVTAISKMR